MNTYSGQNLEEMTVREIAADARLIMNYKGLDNAKELLKDHIAVANRKMKEFSAQLNKKMGTRKSPPKINVISDFNRFR